MYCTKHAQTVSDEPLADQAIWRIVLKRAKSAGVKGDCRAHSLRSGYVTSAIDAGANPSDVMTMTDHKSLATMMKYVRKKSLADSPASKLLMDK